MGHHRFVYLFLLSYVSCLIGSPSSPSSVTAKNVSLSLYYETLCPYSADLIVNGFSKIFDNGLIDIVDLKLVPYGNTRVGSDGSMTCLHGPYECLLNTVEACVLHSWPDLTTHFTFIHCVESLALEGKQRGWDSCFKETGMESTPIFDCVGSGLGAKLELQFAAETNALEPPQEYVPWVVVDGQPLYWDYANFITYVCKAYSGVVAPKPCKELPLRIAANAE